MMTYEEELLNESSAEERDISPLTPQEGPQTAFLSSTADIVIYGGAAGGGKTYGLLLEGCRWADPVDGIPGIDTVIFRRTMPQIKYPGGLWDASMKVYSHPYLGGKPNRSDASWTFANGHHIKFASIQYDDDLLNWGGSEMPALLFDELPLFTRKQFFFLLSRNRTMAPIKPYVRGTCNPDADTWVKELIQPWLDGEVLPGELKWFVQRDDQIVWVEESSRDEDNLPPKSLTFIPASIYDNKLLLANNPEYLSSLRALNFVDRQRLLYGDWEVRAEAGKFINSEWFNIVDNVPYTRYHQKEMRGWDLAATEPQLKGDDPDYTVGVKATRISATECIVTDVVKFRKPPSEVEKIIRDTAEEDGRECVVRWEIEGGSSGPMVDNYLRTSMKKLGIYDFGGRRPRTGKLTRAKNLSAAIERGEWQLLKAKWNKDYQKTLHGVPDGPHDDDLDASSLVYNEWWPEQSRKMGSV